MSNIDRQPTENINIRNKPPKKHTKVSHKHSHALTAVKILTAKFTKLDIVCVCVNEDDEIIWKLLL